MLTKSFARCALVVVLLAGAAVAQQPRRLPPQKPPSLWSRLFGRSKPKPLPPARREYAESVPAGAMPKHSSGVVRAGWEEPMPVRPAPVKRASRTPWPISWLHRLRRPSRTVSDYMAEERP